MADEIPFVPRATPVASAAHIKRRVKFWSAKMGLVAPVKITVRICDCRKGVAGLCNREDPDVYAQCEPQSQYMRARLSFDPWHPGWEEDIDECVRHELAHFVVHSYTTAAVHHAGNNEAAAAVLEDLEDALVTRISNWPVWNEVDG